VDRANRDPEDIRKALKAVDLMKLFDMASRGGPNSEPVVAEHKVRRL
jgi:hypothetical protein